MTDTCAACGGIDRVTGILCCGGCKPCANTHLPCGVEVCSECRVKHEECKVNNEPKPQPCPFCGSEAEMDGIHVAVWVNCGGVECGLYGPTKVTRTEAIAAWNRIRVVEEAK